MGHFDFTILYITVNILFNLSNTKISRLLENISEYVPISVLDPFEKTEIETELTYHSSLNEILVSKVLPKFNFGNLFQKVVLSLVLAKLEEIYFAKGSLLNIYYG